MSQTGPKEFSIAILVSGGDCQILNYLISLFMKHSDKYNLYLVRNGFKGLFDGKIELFDDKKVKINPSTSGAVIGSSRFLEIKQHVRRCKENLERYNIDRLIVLGGDGSYKAAQKIKNSFFIPCTIDNDIKGMHTFGFLTAFEQIFKYHNSILPSVETMGKGLVLETMGNGSNQLALISFLTTYADRCFVNHKIFSDQNCDLFRNLLEKSDIFCINKYTEQIVSSKDTSKIILAEKFADCSQRQVLAKLHRYEPANYFQRSGKPCCLERIVAVKYFERLLAQISGAKNFEHINPNDFLISKILDGQKGVFSLESLIKQVKKCLNGKLIDKTNITVLFKRNDVFSAQNFKNFQNFYKNINLNIVEIETDFENYQNTVLGDVTRQKIVFCNQNDMKFITKKNTVIIPIDHQKNERIFLWKTTILSEYCKLIDKIIENGNKQKYKIECEEWIYENLKVCYAPFIENPITETKMIFSLDGQKFNSEDERKVIFVLKKDIESGKNDFLDDACVIQSSNCYEISAIDEILLRLSLLSALSVTEGIVSYDEFWPKIF